MRKFFKKIPRPSLNMIMTIAAIVISLCALFVSFAEVSIMRTQQKANLYPYLTLGQRYDGEGFGLYLQNKGIGPARINSFQVSTGDTYFNDWVLMANHYLPDSMRLDWGTMEMSNIQHSIIAAGEEVRLVRASWNPASRLLVDNLNDLSLYLCYSSLLDDHWTVTDFEQPIEAKEACKWIKEREMF